MIWVGARVRPVDWETKTNGHEPYAGDVVLKGLLHAAIVRSPYPYALLGSINPAEALTIPGVVAVVTASDIPGEATYIHSGGDLRDRPHLAREFVRYVGEEVAAVAAETPELARQGARAVSVRYRPRRAPLTVQEALDGRSRALHRRTTGEHNVAFRSQVLLGDFDMALAESVVQVRETYTYPRVGHAPMETNATTAAWDDDGSLHLWTASQSPWFVAEEVANALAIPQHKVVCHDVSTGGGFGSKSHVSEQEVLAALLARKSGRPVRLQLSREEEFAATKPRHAFFMDLAVHADEQGTINLIDASVHADNGAYNHYGPSVLMGGLRKLASMYRTECVRWDGRLVDTALPPGGQFRGYGSTQTTFALESAVDELAHKIGADPLDLRMSNANLAGSVARSGIRVGSARLVECLEMVRDEIDWAVKRTDSRPFRGVGVAAAMHGSGAFVYDRANESEIEIVLHADATVTATFGGADAGTGQRTVIAQVLAEELGISPSQVQVVMNSSETFDLGAWSSRGTHISLHVARKAGREVADSLKEEAARKLGTRADSVRLRDGSAWHGRESVDIGDLVPVLGSEEAYKHRSVYVDPLMERIGEGTNYSASYSFAAHAVEVEVDVTTGEIKVLDYVAVHDVGRAINPTMVEGQITGGVVQGLGAALGEQVLYEGGRVVNPTFLNYPLPRSVDTPVVRPFVLAGDEAAGPYGAKSVGEIPILPVGPAVANAVFDAIGIRFRELPITPDKVLTALRSTELRGARGDQDCLTVRPRPWQRPSRWQIEAFRWLYPRGLKRALMITARLSRPRAVPDSTAVHVAPTVEAALELGAVDAASYVAGGTDLLPMRQQALSDATVLISVGSLRDLRRRGISPDDNWWELGAAITLEELVEGDDVPPLLRQTGREIATPLVRGLATVGGNLLQEKRCWFYRNGFQCYKRAGSLSPCYAITGDHRFQHAAVGAHRCQAVTPSDLATSLIALDAQVEFIQVTGNRERIELSDFFIGPGETALPDGAVLTQIRLSPSATSRLGAFNKLALWQGDFALASVAVSAHIVDDQIQDARVVLGGMSPTPMRLMDVEACLEGVSLDEARARASRAFVSQLGRVAHPLPNNRWKLDASVGVLGRAFDDLRLQVSLDNGGCVAPFDT